jgi:PAS domain S-box-containing protein
VIITAIFDENNKHIGFLKVTKDLTERKNAERELMTLQRGIDSIRDYAVILLDTGGHVVKWNKGAERIKGYTAEEILGKHFSIFYPPDVVATNYPNYELAVVRKEGRFEDEGWRMRKDGTRFWASVVITAITDDQEGLVGYIKGKDGNTAR